MRPSSGQIGLLGGSFDPVHNGHLAIARSFLASSYINKLWLIPNSDPPHKKDQTLASYELRYKMLQKAFADFNKVAISNIEKRLPNPSYTVQTLAHLTKQFPHTTFFLCVGADSAQHFTHWYKWKKILSYCQLLVADRSTSKDMKLDQGVAEKAHFINHQPVSVSSTKIRKKVTSAKGIAELVPSAVEKIIRQQNLYKTA